MQFHNTELIIVRNRHIRTGQRPNERAVDSMDRVLGEKKLLGVRPTIGSHYEDCEWFYKDIIIKTRRIVHFAVTRMPCKRKRLVVIRLPVFF